MMESELTYADLEKFNLRLTREAGEVISEFLTDFTQGYDRSFQGPIPMDVLREYDELADSFKTALSQSDQSGRISLELSRFDLANLGGLAYFIACGGEQEITLGEKSYEPRHKPVDLAILDLNEAFVRAGGRDNLKLRNMLEGLGKDEGSVG